MDKENAADAQPATGQTHNDLFDYDVDLDAILGESSTRSNINAPQTSESRGLGLGLDDEVKVTRKRQPIAKLDEGRLLSQAGIPKLRRSAKQKLKFKGKGHEFSDAARLLNFYQLWLDDLFPRAKFTDGLAMIEKLGHSKRIQTMRREWIDQEKPRQRDDDDEPLQEAEGSHHNETSNAADQPSDRQSNSRQSPHPNDDSNDLFMSDEGNPQYVVDRPEAPEEDDLEALLREQEDEVVDKPDGPEEDDLDALLREQADVAVPQQKPSTAPSMDEDRLRVPVDHLYDCDVTHIRNVIVPSNMME
ncbi:chromosome segregation in meiosis-related protein [Aspergillus terreus]